MSESLSNPLVSVIVPVYQSEKTLEKCVDSLREQTYTNIEILLILDGPKDTSMDLALRLEKEDARIHVYQQKNQGVSTARNHGIYKAKGEYIRFLDSDDYVEPDSIMNLMETMIRQNVDLVIGGYHHHYYGSKVLKLPHIVEPVLELQDEDEVCRLYITGFLNMPWNKLYKKSLMKEGFPRDMNLGEDLIFNLRYLSRIKKIAVLNQPICEYIQDDRGTTLSTKRRQDKLTFTFRLYDQVVGYFGKIYHRETAHALIEEKLVTELLDDLEGLAFDKEQDKKEKEKLIKEYYLEMETHNLFSEKKNLQLLDYKIIYYFLKRNKLNTVYLLIGLRGKIVLLRRKMQNTFG